MITGFQHVRENKTVTITDLCYQAIEAHRRRYGKPPREIYVPLTEEAGSITLEDGVVMVKPASLCQPGHVIASTE